MTRSFSLLALAVGLAACSSSAPVLQSAPPSATAEVDGEAADWAGSLQPVEDQPGLSLGVRDDGETMAVALVANTPQQALRLSRGVTFWFDGEGGKSRAFGIGFPVRPERGARGQGRRQRGGGEATPEMGDGMRGGPDPGARMARLRERFNDGADRMTVYRDGGGELQLAVGEVEGIEAAAEWTEAALVVEVRVPVTGGATGYSIGAEPGEAVGLGIETVDVPDEMLQRAQARRGGPGGQARGGRGGARGGRAGAGGLRGRAPQLPTETQWVRVERAN
ncbi:MAG: hypothetical protein AAGI52_01715 [Bacteroidota bacterium]